MAQPKISAYLGTVVAAYPYQDGDLDAEVVHADAQEEAEHLYGSNVRIVWLSSFAGHATFACFKK